jgi:hypothetical protein
MRSRQTQGVTSCRTSEISSTTVKNLHLGKQLNRRLPAQTNSHGAITGKEVRELLKIGTLLAVIFACAFIMNAQESDLAQPDSGVTEIYLAKDDGTGKAGDQASSFVTTDVPIYCVVLLSSATPVTVKMNLVAVAVAGVKADTRVVSTSYTTRENENRVNFTGRPAGEWVPGRYRVDLFIGARPVASREFAVQKASHAKPVSKPQNSRSSDKSRYAGPLKKS